MNQNFTEMLEKSEDPALKEFRERFPDVAGPIGKMFDEFGSQILGRADERVAEVQKKILTEKVPGLSECEVDDSWPAFLDQPDRYGVLRRQAFKQAMSSMNVGALQNIVNDFRAFKGLPASREHAAGPGAPDVQPVTRSFIMSFARNVVGGKYRGKEAEMNAIQAKIDAATAAGRIIDR